MKTNFSSLVQGTSDITSSGEAGGTAAAAGAKEEEGAEEEEADGKEDEDMLLLLWLLEELGGVFGVLALLVFGRSGEGGDFILVD